MDGRIDACYGRFLGPDKLIERAKECGSEGVFRDMLTFLEKHGILVPVLRYREPDEIIVAREAQRYPHLIDPKLPSEPDGSRVEPVLAIEQMRSGWARPRFELSAIHPFDQPPPGAEFLFQDPAVQRMTEDTYRPVPVGLMPNGEQRIERDPCIPLYRGWQAVQLMEIVNETGLRLWFPSGNSPDRALSVLSRHSDERLEFYNVYHNAGHHALAGFRRHQAALEAAAWFRSYAQRELQFADSESQEGGYSTITGKALDELRKVEARLAAEALHRYGIDATDIARMVFWSGTEALDYKRRGHVKPETAFRNLLRDGLDLLFAQGFERAEVEKIVPGLDRVLEQLYPDWVRVQRERALRLFEFEILPKLSAELPPLLPRPDLSRARAFFGWLEAQGLQNLYNHFEKLNSMVDPFDEFALASSAQEISGMAAAVEHICNALGCAPGTLLPKFQHHWNGVGTVARQITTNSNLTKTRAPTFPATIQKFAQNLCDIQTALPADPEGVVARDLLTAVLVRNHGLHNGLPPMSKPELIKLFICMLRAAFLTWHAVSPYPTP